MTHSSSRRSSKKYDRRRSSNKRSSKHSSNRKHHSSNKHRSSNKSNKSKKHSNRHKKKYIPINHPKDLNNSESRILPRNFNVNVVHTNPYILNMENFVKPDEVKELIRLGYERGFERSNVLIDGELYYSNNRTSLTSYLLEDGLPYIYSKPIERLIKRICYVMNCKRSYIENLMMVKYEESKEAYFGNHVDYFDSDEVVDVEGSQRIATFFVYLNTLEEEDGGKTEFPQLGVKCRPVKGSASFWWNRKNGKMLPETEHRGNPVKKTKYGLNVWIRNKSFY